MRKMKKAISAVLILGILAGTGITNVSAFSSDAPEIDESASIASFSDDFDSYPSGVSELSNGEEIGGGWIAKRTENQINNNDGIKMDITFGFGEGSLKMSTNNCTHDKNMNSMTKAGPRAVHSLSSEIGENQIISFDARKSHSSDAFGIQFLSHNNGKNGYIFLTSSMYMQSVKSGNLFYGLYKYNNEELTVLCEKERTAGTNQEGGFTNQEGTSHIDISYYNGKISWNYIYKIGDSVVFSVSDSCVDENPFALDGEELSAELFTSGSDSRDRYVYFDNFRAVKNVPYITAPEPSDVLYVDLFDNANVSEDDGVIDLLADSKIRKIISPQNANKIFTLYLSKDKNEWFKVSNCEFDENGEWTNSKTITGYRYAALSFDSLPDDLKIFTNADDDTTYIALLGNNLGFYSVFDGAEKTQECLWTVSSDAAQIKDGILFPKRRGELVVTSALGDKSLSAKIIIMSEFDFAKLNGSIQNYIADKKPIIDEINRGITNKDKTILTDVFKNTGNYKISDINDIESAKITELDDESFDKFLDRILTYDAFAFSTEDEIMNFFNTVEAEYFVGLLCNVGTADEIKKVITERNEYFNLNLDNEYYKKYEQSILNKLTNTEFVNLIALKQQFTDNIVLTAFDNALSIEMMQSVVEDCAQFLQYNEEHYDKNKCSYMFEQLIANKASLKTVKSIADYIDSVNKPADGGNDNNGNNSGSGNKGGGKKGGGTSFSVDSSTVNEIAETKPQVIGNQNDSIFSDLNNSHWAYESIASLKKIGVVSGNPDGTFKPDNAVTRAEFVKMLLSLPEFDMEEDNEKVYFNDIFAEDWYYNYFVKAKKYGIISGDNNGNVNPNQNITREEMAVIIYRALQRKIMPATAGSDSFADSADISDWARDAVDVLKQEGIFNGDEANKFNPHSNTTRAEACKVFVNLQKRL